MSIKCKYFENDKENVRFEFDCYPDLLFKPKHFKSHAYKYQYDDVLAWANQSGSQWNKTGIFLTAYIDSLWKGMPDSQRNTIFPKVHLMWMAVDGSKDDSIPSWIDPAAGYLPLIKQINSAGDCWFLGDQNDVSVFFSVVNEDEQEPEPNTTLPMTIHLTCPHCGKKIF